jgi:hypothetical protein
MFMCEVVNFKQYGSSERLNQAFGDKWLYIGRANPTVGFVASALANPFKVKDFGGQRGATLGHYRWWLWGQIQAGNEAVLKALKAITPETVLVCYCKPGPCHGDVVKKAAEWLNRR